MLPLICDWGKELRLLTRFCTLKNACFAIISGGGGLSLWVAPTTSSTHTNKKLGGKDWLLKMCTCSPQKLITLISVVIVEIASLCLCLFADCGDFLLTLRSPFGVTHMSHTRLFDPP